MIVTQPKEEIAQFVSNLCSRNHLPFGNYSTIGSIRNGRLVAGVVYNHYSGTNVCAHLAGEGKNWLTRDFLYAIFDYPFNELGVNRITGLVPKKNKRARKLDQHLGFKYEGNMRRALPDDDMLVYGMLRDECRWLDLLQN